MPISYKKYRVVYLALDPVHIGAGGYRLGRVDMTIAREPGSNLPKIPGTSLAGAARSYAAQRYGKKEAAGQHKKLKAKDGCPILYTFGTTSDKEGGQAGVVSICDAHILFLPVTTMRGPFWLTTTSALGRAGWTFDTASTPAAATEICCTGTSAGPLNLGWLLFETVKYNAKVAAPDASCNTLFDEIKNRIVIVHEDVFAQIVNSNLEVRTSVSIDPETGAAEDKALFTYEAIPRATWLTHEVVFDDYRHYDTPFQPVENEFKRSGEGMGVERGGAALGETWESPWDVCKAGLRLIEQLGVGGMGTRGFGRLKWIGSWEDASNG